MTIGAPHPNRAAVTLSRVCSRLTMCTVAFLVGGALCLPTDPPAATPAEQLSLERCRAIFVGYDAYLEFEEAKDGR